MRGAATPLRAAARRPAGGVARSLHTAPGMLVARALPAGLGASSKMYTLFPDGPLRREESRPALHEPGESAAGVQQRRRCPGLSLDRFFCKIHGRDDYFPGGLQRGIGE